MTSAAAATRRRAAARTPRRVSGPVGGRLARPAPESRPVPASRLSLVRPVVDRFRSLPDSSLIDRLVRGRAWIPVLGVMLAGIVAMQVEVLKLGSSMGRWIERSSALTARNQQLRASVASLADDQRIESLAAHMGMVMPVPSALGFLEVRGGTASAALSHIHAPNSVQFLASLPAAAAAASSGGLAAAASPTAGAQVASASPVGPAGQSTGTQASTTDGSGSGAAAQSGPSGPQVSAASTATASPPGQAAGGPAAGQATSGGAAPGGAGIAPPASAGQSSGG